MSAATVWQGRFLAMLVDGPWEYAARTRGIGAAVILVIDAGDVILVEQYRVPLGARCLELPAGLVGDDSAGERAEDAAARELEEETGYRAGRIEPIGVFHSSPGLTSESFTLMRARDLVRIGPGGGTPGEDITVHRVALGEIGAFIAARRAAGVAIDCKLLMLLGPNLLG